RPIRARSLRRATWLPSGRRGRCATAAASGGGPAGVAPLGSATPGSRGGEGPGPAPRTDGPGRPASDPARLTVVAAAWVPGVWATHSDHLRLTPRLRAGRTARRVR